MVPFYDEFPDLAVRETRTIYIRGRNDLPDGEYGFIELYCNEEDCDCRRVLINVMTPDTGVMTWATINYGWERSEFYENWMRSSEYAKECKGPYLDPLNPQTEYGPVLLQLFEFILTDQMYVERLKRHYDLFKGAIQKGKVVERKRRKRRRPGLRNK